MFAVVIETAPDGAHGDVGNGQEHGRQQRC